jgi:hypothetical protein
LCRIGVHACRVPDLPWWLTDELWEIELAGDVLADEHKIVAPAGRLRARIETWTPAWASEYGAACAWRARDRTSRALRRANHERAAARLAACTTLSDLQAAAQELAEVLPDGRITLKMARGGAVRALTGAAPTAAYIAAHVAARTDGPGAYTAGRRWQAQWLKDRLGLDPA